MSDINLKRRRLLGTATAGLAALELAFMGVSQAADQAAGAPSGRMPVKQVNAGVLDVGYHEAGPADGPVVILLHGFPYDIHSYVDVAPILAARGYRVIVPHLRGHGSTRFLSASTPRTGQQAAVAQDTIALMDALKIERAILAGYDWGSRTACAVAALWPERVVGIVSVNGYLVQDISKAAAPIPAKIEFALWYQYYFATERGRTALTNNRRDIAKVVWAYNSPVWRFDDATFERSMVSLDNPDYVAIVIHNYRFRLGLLPGFPQYEALERRLAALPKVGVPAVTLDGAADGIVAATDGKAYSAKFSGPFRHHVVPAAGHNLPQEAAQAFADAVLEVAALARSA
jgi:pimeloyl-ACP methyl ester carboxylesterase